MPDEITVNPKSEAKPDEPQTIPSPPPTAPLQVQLINIAAIILGLSFFLPWTQILGQSVSGFDIQKLGEAHRLLWLIPIFSAITVFAGFTNRSQKIVAQLTGALPFFVLGYWLYQLGGDLLKALSLGAWIALISGLVLFLLPRNLK